MSFERNGRHDTTYIYDFSVSEALIYCQNFLRLCQR